jgi:hypothetical protein
MINQIHNCLLQILTKGSNPEDSLHFFPFLITLVSSSSSKMMLNVSRTSVSESWLSSVAKKSSVGYNALDKEAFVTVCDLIYPYFTYFMSIIMVAGKESIQRPRNR